jgi:hypothetical protein
MKKIEDNITENKLVVECGGETDSCLWKGK